MTPQWTLRLSTDDAPFLAISDMAVEQYMHNPCGHNRTSYHPAMIVAALLLLHSRL